MEFEKFILIFLFVSVSTFLFMQAKLTDYVLGFCLLSNGINLMILFTSDDPEGKAVPIIAGAVQKSFVDPLPQALILTAIVIGFGLTAFMIVLSFRLFGYFGTSETTSYTKIEKDE